MEDKQKAPQPKKSKSRNPKYDRYRSKYPEVVRKRRERHSLKHPNDKQSLSRAKPIK